MSTYKPTGNSNHPPPDVNDTNGRPEHDGLKEDGTPDKRVGTGGM